MRDAEQGTYNGDTTYCTVNAYGACPWCDQCNVCHMSEPFDCPDWRNFWHDWDEWQRADTVEESFEEWLEMGYNPFIGGYDDDC
mgnify:CR=1 FL=1